MTKDTTQPGRLIAFEGIDGCGKSTQAAKLKKVLNGLNKPFIEVREPGTTPAAEAVRRILLQTEDAIISPEGELFLYLAARADLYKQTVLPALEKGAIVLSDRCFWSTVAYQGAGLELGIEKTHTLSLYATANREPDLVFLFDLAPETAAKRRSGSDDRIESRSRGYLEQVRAAFLDLARKKPEKSAILDGADSVENIHRNVLTETANLLKIDTA